MNRRAIVPVAALPPAMACSSVPTPDGQRHAADQRSARRSEASARACRPQYLERERSLVLNKDFSVIDVRRPRWPRAGLGAPGEAKRPTRLPWCPLVVLCLAWMLAGCSSTPPSPTVAVAVTQARQRMTEAARLVQQGNWPAAARAWQDVGDRFALLDDLASQAQALHHLARVQRELGDLARSHALLEQASALCAETRSSNAGWLAQIELVQVEFLMRQTNAARQRLEILATQQHAMADPHTRGLLLNELGLDQQRRGALDSAALSYQQARAAFRQAKSDAGLAAVACNQAQVHMDQGQPARAVPLWQQALERYRMLGDVRRIAYCLLGQGEAILAAGRDLVAAEKNLRQAAENYRLLQHHEGRIRSLESLAACLQRQQKESLAAAVRHDLEALRRRP